MIDFVKIIIKDVDLVETVWNNPFLEYHSETGRRVSVDEVRQIDKRSYKNMLFTRYSERLEIAGSFHYLFNDGVHNANQFSDSNCIETIQEFISLFQLKPQYCKVVNLEYGVNIISPFNVKKVVTSLRYHSKNEFRTLPNYQYSKQSNKFDTKGNANKYKVIKAYAKGLQVFNEYVPDQNTFRFEVKSNKAKYFKTLGIETIADFLSPEVYHNCKKHLLHEWSHVLLIDTLTDTSSCSSIQKYLSLDYWENAVQGHRNTFTSSRKKYMNLMCSFPDNMYSALTNIIENQLFFEPKKGVACSGSVCLSVSKAPAYEKEISVHFPTYIKREYAYYGSFKSCRLTGLNISMQRECSDLLSHSGLRYYHENNRDVFEYLKKKFLSDRWNKSNLDQQIKEIAHNIRNHSGNIMRKQKRIYNDKQYSLFNC